MSVLDHDPIIFVHDEDKICYLSSPDRSTARVWQYTRGWRNPVTCLEEHPRGEEIRLDREMLVR